MGVQPLLPEVIITRRFDFCAGHRLAMPDLSDAENEKIFGPCSNPAGHGHNYTLEVSVTGPVSAGNGMVMNLRTLKEQVNQLIISSCDHKNLNTDVPWMQGLVPTTEQFALAIWKRLQAHFTTLTGEVSLVEITLHETPNNKVRIRAAAGT